MKWLLILFATYMLVLPCIPCSAGEVCCKEEHADALVAGSASEEKLCTAEDDDCTSEERSCSDDSSPDEKSCPAQEHSCPSEKDQTRHEHTPTCPCCPSFSCNTCHSLIVSANLVLEEPSIPILNVENISFADEPLANFSAIIWQPPKALYL